MKSAQPATYLRSVILKALTVCVLLVIAPWGSGGQDGLAQLVAGGALLLGALLVWRQPEVRRLKWGPLTVVWWLLIGVAVLSLAWTASRYHTGVWLMQWAMAGLAFWLAYVVAGESRGRAWVTLGYLVSAGVFGIVAVWMYLTGSYDRLTGTFYWANPAAAYLLPAIILAVDRWREQVVVDENKRSNKKLYIWVILAVFLMTAFGLTDSRGAGLVLVLISILYLLVVPTPKRFWIIFVFNLVVAGALILGLGKLSNLIAHHDAKAVPGARLAEVAEGGSQSVTDRWRFVESGLRIWWDHPWGGTGAGTYGDVHPQYQRQVVSASSDAHNVYVQMLAELGLVGALLLAGVLLWLVVGLARGVAKEPTGLATALGGVGLLLHFGLDIDARYPALLMLAAVLCGLVYRQHRMQWRPGTVGPVLVAVALMVPVVTLYQDKIWAQRAQVDQQDGDYDLAAEHYARAQSGGVFDPDWVNAEGINWYAQGTMPSKDAKAQLAAALDRARLAERLDPHDGQHHQLEGRVLAAQGDVKAAERALEAALVLDPLNHPDYALDLASWQAANGEVASARRTAEQMLALYSDKVVDNRSNDPVVRPAVADLAALVGNLDLQEGKRAAAKVMAQRALRVQPGNLRGRALLRQVETAE